MRVDQLLEGWNRFWFAKASTRSLSLLRIAFGVVLLQYLTGLWGIFRLQNLDPSFPRDPVFESGGGLTVPMPYPALAWLPTPPHDLQRQIEVLLLVLAVLMIVGLGTRYVMPMLAVGFGYLFLQTQWNYHHHSFLFLLVLAILSFAPTGDHYSVDAMRLVDPPDDASILPRRLLQTLVVILYLFTFLSKLNPGWLGGEMVRLLAAFQFRGPLGTWAASNLSPQLMGVSAVAAEGFVLLGLLFPKVRKAAFVVGILLHLGIDAVMDVGTFSYEMIALYLAFIDPAGGRDRSAPGRRRRDGPRVLRPSGGSIPALSLTARVQPVRWHTVPPGTMRSAAIRL